MRIETSRTSLLALASLASFTVYALPSAISQTGEPSYPVDESTCKSLGAIEAYFSRCGAPGFENTHIQGNGASKGFDDSQIILPKNFTSFCLKSPTQPSNQQAALAFQTTKQCGFRPWPDPRFEKLAFFTGDCWDENDYSGFVDVVYDGTGCHSFSQEVTSFVVLPADFDLASAPNFRNNTLLNATRESRGMGRSNRRSRARSSVKTEI